MGYILAIVCRCLKSLECDQTICGGMFRSGFALIQTAFHYVRCYREFGTEWSYSGGGRLIPEHNLGRN